MSNVDDNKEEDNIEEDNIEEDNIKEDNIKEDNIEEDNIEEDNIKEDNINEDNIEEDNIEEDNIKEDNIKEDNIEDDNIEEDNIEEDNKKSNENSISEKLSSIDNNSSLAKEISNELLSNLNDNDCPNEEQPSLMQEEKVINEVNSIKLESDESKNNNSNDFRQNLNEEAIRNIQKRCNSAKNRNSLHSKNQIIFCNLPPSAKVSKSVTRPQTSTMVTFSKSLRSPSLYDPNILYYRDREVIEEKQKKKFDSMIHNKYYTNSIYSPYKCDLCSLRKKSIKKTKLNLKKRELCDRRERFISTKQYLKAAKEAIDHDKKLVKKDYFPFDNKSLRILDV